MAKEFNLLPVIMKRYHELKAKYPESILLFRQGDFYEAYEDDAEVCAQILGITLTRRNSDRSRLAGFPYHAIDTYLPKIVRAGYRVGLCDPVVP